MRTFQAIQSDIEETKRRFPELTKEMEEAKYSTRTDGIGAGIGAMICGLLGSFCLVCVFDSFSIIEVSHFARNLPGAFLFFALVLAFPLIGASIYNAVTYAQESMRYKAALAFLIVSSGVTVLFSGAFLWYMMTKERLSEQLAIPEKELTGDVWLGCVLFLIPVLIVLTASLVKFLKECKLKKQCQKKVSSIRHEIDCQNELLKTLKKELIDTETEAKKILAEERKKPKPDVARIQEAADVGLLAAQEWLNERKKRNDRLRGDEIYVTEIQSQDPKMQNMQKAAKLGQPDAGLWVAKQIALSFVFNMSSFADAELREYSNELRKYVDLADSCNDRNLYYVLEALAELCGLYGDDESISKAEEMATLKKLRAMAKKEVFQDEADIRLMNYAIKLYVHAINCAEAAERIVDAFHSSDRKFEEAVSQLAYTASSRSSSGPLTTEQMSE